jgi:hypothetical protein
MRADSSGSPFAEFLALISTSARWVASAARARSSVVLLGLRIAEEGHQAVAKSFQQHGRR